MRFDDFDTQITCEEYYGDPEQDQFLELDPDDDYVENEDDWWNQPDPYGEEDEEWDPPLVDASGVTADGYALLAEMDSRGEFV